MWAVLLVPLTMGVIVGVSHEYKSMPAWFHKTAFVIRKIAKVAIYVALAVFIVLVILPVVVSEGSIWLFPNGTFGYSVKFEVNEKDVFVQPKPHDCEWDKAPIGNKYCHFESVVTTENGANGKIKAVYVGWQKINE